MCPYLGMSAFSSCEEGPRLLGPGCPGRVALWSPMKLAVAPFRTSMKPMEHLALHVPAGPHTFLPWATVVSQKHDLSCLGRSLSFTRITSWMRNPKFHGLYSHYSGNKKQSQDLMKMGRSSVRSLRGLFFCPHSGIHCRERVAANSSATLLTGGVHLSGTESHLALSEMESGAQSGRVKCVCSQKARRGWVRSAARKPERILCLFPGLLSLIV